MKQGFFKWNLFLFGGIVFFVSFFFFRYYNTDLYQRQEELQFFIPRWSFFGNDLLLPGGFCRVAGQFATQYYCYPIFALLLNATLLCGIGCCGFILLQRIAKRHYNYALALVPIIGLCRVQLNLNYATSGTIGLLIISLALTFFSQLEKKRSRLIYGIASVAVVYFLAGTLALPYGLLLLAYEIFIHPKNALWSIIPIILAAILTYCGARLMFYLPLEEGLKPESFHEAQVRPDSYIYYVWIRFAIVQAVLFLIGFLLSKIPWSRIWGKVVSSGFAVMVLLSVVMLSLPNANNVQNKKIYRLMTLSQQEKWTTILQENEGRVVPNYISLNYINMALAKEGLLGDKLFCYDQKGPNSLLCEWDRTYFASSVLSDIHFMIGDLSKAEGYAMDAKRIGCPQMLQRLAQIYLIKGEYAIAKKYIDLLEQMPAHRQWAEKHREYLNHPERLIAQMENNAASETIDLPDNLLSLTKTDSTWLAYVDAPSSNEIAFNYLGCLYLLEKNTDSFKHFICHIGGNSKWQPLPTHFQEAVALLSASDPALLDSITVGQEITQKFKQFQIEAKQAKNQQNKTALFKNYGNTFWFYYYFK